MINHNIDSVLEAQIKELKKEIALKDYQVTKASRYGVHVDDLYPGHTAWYEEKIGQLHQLEKQSPDRQIVNEEDLKEIAEVQPALPDTP